MGICTVLHLTVQTTSERRTPRAGHIMTFLSPGFMFIFLPLSLAVYSLVPKYLKSYSLPIFGCLFYVSLNLRSLPSLIILPLSVIGVTVAVELYRKHRSPLPLTVCRVLMLAATFGLLFIRIIGGGHAIGIGSVFCLMAGLSLCSDVLHGRGRLPDTAWDAVVYMTFFPLMLVGPFVRYGDFVEKVDRISFNTDNFASGAMRFIIGLLKCICVAAVLEEAYVGIVSTAENEMSYLTVTILAVICGIRVFYLFSGYSDMARGVASMLGLRIPGDFSGHFSSVTPCDYVRGFCSGLLSFCRTYVTVPVSEIVSGIGGNSVAAVFAAFFYLLLFAGNIEILYLLMLPTVTVMIFIVLRTGHRRRRINPWLRVLGSVATFLTVSFFWWMIKIGSLEDLTRVFELAAARNAMFISPRLLSILGDVKYTLLPLSVGIVCSLISRTMRKDDAYLDSLQRVGDPLCAPVDTLKRTVMRYASAVILLITFCLTVMILLPQYPELASTNHMFRFF